MAPQPTAKMDQEATRPIDDHQEKESLLVKEGGLKSLFEQFTKEEKGGGERTARDAPGSSLIRSRVEEKRQSLTQHEDTEEREPPVKPLVDYKPISVPQKTVLQRLEAPTPEYRSEEEHLADTREIESSSQLDARELRDDPVRLSRKDIMRERDDVELPRPETQTKTDGISPII